MRGSRGLYRPGVLVAALMLAACAGEQTRIDGRQFVAVENPEQPKQILLVLRSYSGCEPQDQACRDRLPQLAELQAKFESCVAEGLLRTGPHVTLIRHAQWGAAADQQAIISELAAGKPVSTSRLAPEKIGFEIDYLVSIGVEKSRSDKRLVAEVTDTSPGMVSEFIVVPPTALWGIGQEWTNSAVIQTRVFSAHTGKLTGELSADLSEDAFWVLPVITIVPLVPFGSSPDVETTTCKEMGEALGRFFSGAGNEYLE